MDQPTTSTSNEGNKFSVRLKHKKCCVIQQTREQMSNFDNRYDDENGSFSTAGLGSRFRHYWKFIKDNQCCIMMILFVLFMAWFCIMIGVLIGATSCSNSQIVSPFFHLKIPGLSWGTEESNPKCWKVF